jgi:hypothetical protein
MLFKNVSSTYAQVLLCGICFLSFFLSINVGIILYDLLHPVKMFVEANQLLSGLIPYKEIFIANGYLTTILHSLSIILFGNQILSVSVITGIFYALTFPIFFLILKNFKIEKEKSILSIIVIFLIHPSIQLPWPNYFAYFFFILGLYYFTKNKPLKKDYILMGFFWSLACLSRQTFFLPLFLGVFLILILEFFSKKFLFLSMKKNNFAKSEILFLLISFFLPLLLFIAILFYNQIYKYWVHFTFDLSSFHLRLQSSESGSAYYSLLSHIIKSFLDFFLAKNFNSFFFLIIVIFNIYFLLLFCKKKYDMKIFSISVLSLLMLSQNIHYIEIFRMSTSVIVGFIPLIYFYKNKKLFTNFLYFFIFILFFYWGNNTYNLFKLKYNYVYSNVSYLRFQKMPKNFAVFNDEAFKIIKDIKADYIIDKNFNYTSFPIFPLLSDTKSYQFGSYYDEGLDHLYSTETEFIKLKNSLKNFNDIIIFYPSNDQKLIQNKFRNDFFLIKSLESPHPESKYVQFLLHKNVKKHNKIFVE